MNKFVENLSLALHRERPRERYVAVLSNEAGDLDSICSSTILAFHLSEHTKERHIPVMAFSRKDLPLKTEALYAFGEEGLDPNKLIFAEDLKGHEGQISGVFLVDNHFISVASLKCLEPKITAVMDHRPWEIPATYYSSKTVDEWMEIVGSCATLVATKIFKENCAFNDQAALTLLRGCILLDTGNLSKKALKATERDIDTLQNIERRLVKRGTCPPRLQQYDALETAKENVSSFSLSMLIRKDLKTLSWPGTGCLPIALSVIPGQSSFKVLQRPDFNEHAEKLLNPGCRGFGVIALFGSDDLYDILIMGTAAPEFRQKIVTMLLGIQDANMEVVPYAKIQSELGVPKSLLDKFNVTCMTFPNRSYSRKRLLPLIKTTIEEELESPPKRGTSLRVYRTHTTDV